MSNPGLPLGVCWFCGREIPPARARVETVLQTRAAAHGGPFQTIVCIACHTIAGALRNRRGEWLFHPLDGAEEPTLLDRLVPRTSRRHAERSRAWWLAHGEDLARFRSARETPRRASPRTAGRVPPASKAAAPRPPRAEGPHAILGVAEGASPAEVRRAWRAAVKRWHPDRIPTADPVVLNEARRRFEEIRAAYEALGAGRAN